MALTDPTAHWTARLGELAAARSLPGAALGIWHDGEETLSSYGVLSTATGVTATPDSLFQIGSITKVWTATMIMQLVEEGRLTLDATVAEVLPGSPSSAPRTASAEVTVRHLLTHTSGIDGDIFTDTGRGDDCVERYVDAAGRRRRATTRSARPTPTATAASWCSAG